MSENGDHKHDLSGPSFGTLKKLHESLPSMVKGLKEGKIGGKGNKVVVQHPNKVCKVCCKAFDMIDGPPPDKDKLIEKEHMMDPCPDCDALLKDGYIAFVSGDRYAFCKSERLADLGGTIVPVALTVMQKMEDVFGMEWKTKEPSNNGDENPPN